MTNVLIESPKPGVTLVTLNRPEKRNALSSALMAELTAALRGAGTDTSTRCVVLTGAPPAFCAGGDLAEIRAGDDAAFGAYLECYRSLAEAVRALPCPLIAAVNGAAIAGGFELMCLADMRVIDDEAIVAVGDVDIGLAPTSGLTWLLPRMVGVGRAKWLALANPRLTGAEAYAIGIAEERAAVGTSVEQAVERAAMIAAKPGQGVRLTRLGIDLALDSSYGAAVAWEFEAERVAFADPAVGEALDAFLARRRPGAEYGNR
jgi:2-(1,2-epoxy-1,2-dihydrophenyl)acetyl-CoA isomerase